MWINEIQQLLSNPLIGAGTVMTLMGGLFYTLRQVPEKIFKFTKDKITQRLIYTVRIYDYDELFDVFEQWLYKYHPKRYKDVQASISTKSELGSPNEKKKIPKIFYRQAPTIFTIKYKGNTFFINKTDEKLDHATSFSTLYAYKYTIRGFNCQHDIKSFLQDVVNDYYTGLNKNSIRVRTNDEYGYWKTGSLVKVKPVDKIILHNALKNSIITDIQSFQNSRDWYFQTNIPYKRTYCFHGRPGTGKTSLSLAIASYTDRDVYAINISTLKNDSALQTAFSEIGDNALLLLEDVDAAFRKRESKDGITFSCLLNCLDGAFYKEGLITCITTNHLDKLDSALLRAGRTDLIAKIEYPKLEQINEFLSVFYQQPISIECNCENIMLSMSEIQEICISNRNSPNSAEDIITTSLLTIINNVNEPRANIKLESK